MRYILLILASWLWISNALQAQPSTDIPPQIWTDFVIGKPDMYALEARRTVARQWGIRYRAITAGCVVSDKVLAQAQQYQQHNQPYWETLDRRYGKDWRPHFDRDVLRQQHLLRQKDQPKDQIWYELISKQLDATRLDPTYLTTKKMVAARWGIRYAPLYVDDLQTEAQRATAEAKSNQSYSYAEQISQRLGPDWIDWIEEETHWALLAQAPVQGLWQDPIWGAPDTLYYSAKAAVAQRWNIHYQPLYLGTQRPASTPLPTQNGAYFAQLQAHFGTTWWQRFYREVAQEYWSRQLPTNP